MNENLREIGYSVNQFDSDGDLFDQCILVHMEDKFIIRFGSLKEYDDFIDGLQSMRDDIANEWKQENK